MDAVGIDRSISVVVVAFVLYDTLNCTSGEFVGKSGRERRDD